jgi:hypothetical protein
VCVCVGGKLEERGVRMGLRWDITVVCVTGVLMQWLHNVISHQMLESMTLPDTSTVHGIHDTDHTASRPPFPSPSSL